MSNVDWGFWKHKTSVKQWQAAFLSCGIDPDTQRYRDIEHYGLDNEKVSKRLRLLKDNSHLKVFFSPSTINIGDANLSHVKLSEFAAWCLHIGYDIPSELEILAKAPNMAPATQSNKSSIPPKKSNFIEDCSKESDKNDITTDKQTEKSWLICNSNDPKPAQPWYTPARYFARQLVVKDSTLLNKRDLLAKKVAASLKSARFYKRGGKLPLDPATVKKAFANVNFG
jgi:hypothetical protein